MSNPKTYRVPYAGQGSILGLEEVEAVTRTLQQDTLAYDPTLTPEQVDIMIAAVRRAVRRVRG